MSGASENPLWSFSLAIYGKPGVAESCLELQDQQGADVNILLFLCWTAITRAAPLGDEEIRAAMRHTGEWQTEVILPLRVLRRRLRSAFRSVPEAARQGFRERIKEAELEAERIEQAMLHAYAGAISPARPDSVTVRHNAKANLMAYLSCLECPATPEIRRKLTVLVEAACAVSPLAPGSR